MAIRTGKHTGDNPINEKYPDIQRIGYEDIEFDKPYQLIDLFVMSGDDSDYVVAVIEVEKSFIATIYIPSTNTDEYIKYASDEADIEEVRAGKYDIVFYEVERKKKSRYGKYYKLCYLLEHGGKVE